MGNQTHDLTYSHLRTHHIPFLHKILEDDGGIVIFMYCSEKSWDALEPLFLPILEAESRKRGRVIHGVWADSSIPSIRDGAMASMGIGFEDLPSAALLHIEEGKPVACHPMIGMPLMETTLKLLLKGFFQGTLRKDEWPVELDTWGAFIQAFMAHAPQYFMDPYVWLMWRLIEQVVYPVMHHL